MQEWSEGYASDHAPECVCASCKKKCQAFFRNLTGSLESTTRSWSPDLVTRPVLMHCPVPKDRNCPDDCVPMGLRFVCLSSRLTVLVRAFLDIPTVTCLCATDVDPPRGGGPQTTKRADLQSFFVPVCSSGSSDEHSRCGRSFYRHRNLLAWEQQLRWPNASHFGRSAASKTCCDGTRKHLLLIRRPGKKTQRSSQDDASPLGRTALVRRRQLAPIARPPPGLERGPLVGQGAPSHLLPGRAEPTVTRCWSPSHLPLRHTGPALRWPVQRRPQAPLALARSTSRTC